MGERKRRVRTVEYDPGWGWIARNPFTGEEIMERGFRWRTRDVARTVVDECRIFRDDVQSPNPEGGKK